MTKNIAMATNLPISLQSSLEAFRKYVDSPEFVKQMAEENARNKVRDQRFLKLESYLQSLSKKEFDKLVIRLIDEHDDKLSDYWYAKGIQPMPTNKMQFLLDYLFDPNSLAIPIKRGTKTYERYGTGFHDIIIKYRTYVFQMFFGQGVAHRITKDRKIIFGGW